MDERHSDVPMAPAVRLPAGRVLTTKRSLVMALGALVVGVAARLALAPAAPPAPVPAPVAVVAAPATAPAVDAEPVVFAQVAAVEPEEVATPSTRRHHRHHHHRHGGPLLASTGRSRYTLIILP